MRRALSEEPSDDGVWRSADDVGEFRQGTPFSQWALARYLVGRALAESLGHTLLVIALVMLGLAAASQWGLHSTFLAIVLVVLALAVLVVRAGLRAVLRRLTEANGHGPVGSRLRALVRDTRSDVLRELRRIGLPAHTVTLPLLAVRLLGRRRSATLARLRAFEIDRAVPKDRLDELHMLLGREQ